MKTLPRRQFLHLIAGAATLPAASRFAWAQTYPSRPVRILVGTGPGATLDIVARLIGQWLAERLGQPFVIENRPGASSHLAAEAVVRADPDGYTLLLIPVGMAINTSLHQHRSFDLLRDIAPVASLVRVPLVMMVHPSIPARTVPEFIAYARGRADKLSYASPGIGTSPHLSGELFKMLTGVDMLHVPYRGGPSAYTDLLAGRVPVMFDVLPSHIESIKAGRLRALAVTTASRVKALPDVPTLGEFLPGYETSSWQGVGAPRNTSAEIVGKLNEAINAALADPRIKTRLADLGATTFASSPEGFRTFIADETEKWAKVVKLAGLKAD